MNKTTAIDNGKRLQIIGCSDPVKLDAVFASELVDVAYIDELTADGALVIADDPNWLSDASDFKWLCSVIERTLAKRGLRSVGFRLVPRPP